MSRKAEEPKGAKLVTKHKNGVVETEILFRLSEKHPVNPRGVGYWTTFEGSKGKK